MKTLTVSLAMIATLAASPAYSELYRHTLHDGRDPFTLPRTKTDWVPSSIPGVPAPRTQCQYMHSKVIIVIEGNPIQDAKKAAESCVREGLAKGMTAAVLTAIGTGGAGAVEAGVTVATGYIGDCLSSHVPAAATPKIKIENPTGWGNWGGC